MCGIFGISYGPGGPAAEDWTPTDAAQLMFDAIEHRGPHAFGWMTYNPASGISSYKQPGSVKKHLPVVQLDDECSWMVGHVRFATAGLPANNNNNHPITHGGVIGVHNGTLDDGWQDIIAETGREHDDAQVDSEAIFAAVDKWGIKPGLNKIDGNVVTVFSRTHNPEILHLARTYGRPLVYGFTEAGSMVFASERGVLDVLGWKLKGIVDMHGARYRYLTIKTGKITSRCGYRSVESTKTFKQAARPTPLSIEQGGVHGITDYFDKQRQRANESFQDIRKRNIAGTSLAPQGRAQGTAQGRIDEWGGEYIGAGWYRAANGSIMSVEAYIKFQVNNEVAKREVEDDAEYEAWLAEQEREGKLQ